VAAQSPDPGVRALRASLDALAERGTRMLRRRIGTERQYRAILTGAPLLLVGPVVILAVQLVQVAAGARVWDCSLPRALVAALIPWAVAARIVRWHSDRRAISRSRAIGLFDEAAGAEERLVAADELLRSGVRGPFVEAAIEDARWFVPPAAAAPLRRLAPDLGTKPGQLRRLLGCVAGACAMAAVASQLGGGISSSDAIRARAAPPAVVADAARPPPVQPERTKEPDRPESAEPSDSQPESKAGEAEAPSKPTELPDEAKRKEGVGGSGRSSRAESSRGESDARGAPTNQAQESKQPATKKPMKPEAKKERKKKEFATPPEAKKAAGEESGSTTGRGSSRGSNKNPVTSDWTSKDQVTTDEDEEIEDDEDVEDETSDSEARGGVQPHLRDRKPPVSRDLGIGFGNQPNPNANGRGGPSQPKKSRGTASLVLGVPIPDRVKGQPNPGKTKVTQERVEPRRERAGPETAQARLPRDGPTTVLARPEITGWLRELVRAYFLDLRKKESNPR